GVVFEGRDHYHGFKPVAIRLRRSSTPFGVQFNLITISFIIHIISIIYDKFQEIKQGDASFFIKPGIPSELIGQAASQNLLPNPNLINHQLQLVVKINKRSIITSVTSSYI
ncbi:MAG: hypothetical protein K9M99_10920, partial [Candidatus Cloacimonetes bacterium]|nr:hypothetical protein [Candidatus Cloacimonadota bacterium]